MIQPKRNKPNERPCALISGASAGIGMAFAKTLAKEGYDLVLIARRENKLQVLAKTLSEEFGISITIIAMDLSEPSTPQRIYEKLRSQGIEVHLLVNNAGFALAKPFVGTPWEEQQALIDVMIVSLTKMCHLFIPQMKERGCGHIINVGSISAYTPELPGNLYNAAKAYVVHMSEALDMELKPYGINCLALCPGLTKSDFHQTMGVQEALNFLPKWRWMASEKVAEEGYKAVTKGRHIYINGKVNRLLVSIFSVIPKRAKYYLGAKGIVL